MSDGLSVWFPWELVSPRFPFSGRPHQTEYPVFFDFFVIYTQNGFFLEASESL